MSTPTAPERSAQDRLVNAAGAADLLGVKPSWVKAEARADRIPHVRLGRYVRFEPAELERWWVARPRSGGAGRVAWTGLINAPARLEPPGARPTEDHLHEHRAG